MGGAGLLVGAVKEVGDRGGWDEAREHPVLASPASHPVAGAERKKMAKQWIFHKRQNGNLEKYGRLFCLEGTLSLVPCPAATVRSWNCPVAVGRRRSPPVGTLPAECTASRSSRGGGENNCGQARWTRAVCLGAAATLEFQGTTVIRRYGEQDYLPTGLPGR